MLWLEERSLIFIRRHESVMPKFTYILCLKYTVPHRLSNNARHGVRAKKFVRYIPVANHILVNTHIEFSQVFDVCMTMHHQYNNINNQLDATITVY